MIPLIVNSVTGKALQNSGFALNATRIAELQKKSEVLCDPTISKNQVLCDPYKGPCLFNLADDPCELRNVAETYPKIVEKLLSILHEYNSTALPPLKREIHPQSNPRKWGNVWTTFMDNLETGVNPDFPEGCNNNNSAAMLNSKSFISILIFTVIGFLYSLY